MGSSDQDYRRASPHDGDEIVCCCAIWWKVEVREFGIPWRLSKPGAYHFCANPFRDAHPNTLLLP